MFRVPCSPILSALIWHSLDRLPAVAALVAALAAGVWLLYSRQARGLPARWRWVLRGLRLAALVALALSMLQPAARRARTAAEQGAIVVLVDRSRSMGICDTQRSKAQLVALADGLGRLPAGTRAGAADALIADVREAQRLLDDLAQAQADLDFLALSGKETQAATARRTEAAAKLMAAAQELAEQRGAPKIRNSALAAPLVDLQESLKIIGAKNPAREAARAELLRPKLESIADASVALQTSADQELYTKNPRVRAVCDELAHLTRLGLAEQALARPDTGILWRLPTPIPVYGFSFDQTLAPLPLRTGGGPVSRLSLEPGGEATHLNGALRAAMQALKGVPIRAVLVFSDGRQTAAPPEERDVGALSNLLWSSWGSASDASPNDEARRVPVFTVAAAPAEAPKDLSILTFAVPREIFAGQVLTARATLRGMWMRGTSVEVRFAIDGVAQVRQVTLGNDGKADVQFASRIIEPGVHLVELSLPELPGEANAGNNRIERRVKVLGDKVLVTAAAGSPGWDFRFLCDDLAKAPWATLRQALLDGPARLPLSPQEILRQDVIVLTDVSPSSLDAGQWDAVCRMVEAGGGAILVAGSAHLPAEYFAEHALPVPAGLFPFTGKGDWHSWRGETAIARFAPAAGAAAEPLLQLADDPAATGQRWDALPPVYRYWQPPPLKPGAQPLLIETESASPVLIRERLGRGTVIFLGIDETWRWRYKAGERDAGRFWEQMIRSLAEPPYLLEAGPLSLDVEPVTAQPGEPLEVRARWYDPAAPSAAAPTMTVEVLKSATLVQTARMIPARSSSTAGQSLRGASSAAPDPAAPAAACGFALHLSGLPAGDYDLRITTPATSTAQPTTAPSAAIHCPLHIAPDFTAELADVTGDRAALRRIAEISGGAPLSLETVSTLPDRLAAAVHEVAHNTEIPLWDSKYLFLFVLACLAAEWGLRKGFGLA